MTNQIRHPLELDDADLADVRTRVGNAIGKKVGASARFAVPGTPGVIIFDDEETGEELAIDPAVVATALAESHQAQQQADATPPAGSTVFSDLAKNLAAAKSDQDRWSVLAQVLSGLVDQENQRNQDAVARWQAQKDARAQFVKRRKEKL